MPKKLTQSETHFIIKCIGQHIKPKPVSNGMNVSKIKKRELARLDVISKKLWAITEPEAITETPKG